MKPLRYHPSVQRDIDEAMNFYIREASEKVALEFWRELSGTLEEIRLNPGRFHFDETGLRRCNLKVFPYNILFEESSDRIRVQVVRHNSRRPQFGSRRKRG